MTSSSPGKTGPLDRYLAVAQHWRNPAEQVPFGGGRRTAKALERPVKPASRFQPVYSLLVTGGLSKLSMLVLGGDTGVTHLAVALGKRVVMVMNSMAPGSPFPYQHPDWTVAPPDGRGVLGIEPGTVITACTRAVNEQAGNVSD